MTTDSEKTATPNRIWIQRDQFTCEEIARVRRFGDDVEYVRADLIPDTSLVTSPQKPIEMILYCPFCGEQHIDEPKPDIGWNDPPHRSHECQKCKRVWRPADVATRGVRDIATKGKADIPAPMESTSKPKQAWCPHDGGTINYGTANKYCNLCGKQMCSLCGHNATDGDHGEMHCEICGCSCEFPTESTAD
jgi:hypothetical protein